MLKIKFTLLILFSILFYQIAFLDNSFAYSNGIVNKKVIRDSNGNVVHSMLSGYCVVSKWNTSDINDQCINEDNCNEYFPNNVQLKPRTKHNHLNKNITSQESVYLDFNKYNLSKKSIRKLNNIKKKLHNNTIISVEIVGFADSVGSKTYNLSLSKKRAMAVRDFFVKDMKIAPKLISVIGLGEVDNQKKCNDNPNNCYKDSRFVEINVKSLDK